jgi:hypothetical protein
MGKAFGVHGVTSLGAKATPAAANNNPKMSILCARSSPSFSSSCRFDDARPCGLPNIHSLHLGGTG